MLRLFQDSDQRLAQKAQAGDQEAFEKLVHRYIGIAHAVAYAQTGNRHDSEDIAQDVFLAAYQALGTLRDTSSFGPWLTTMARNKAIDLVRKRERRSQLAKQLEPAADNHSEDPASHERHEIVRQQVMALEEGPREVLLMHYFAGKSVREIAAALRIEKPAAQKRLARARETLSANLLALLQEEGALESRRKEQAKKVMAAIAALPKVGQIGSPAAAAQSLASATTAGLWSLSTSVAAVFVGTLVVSCIVGSVVMGYRSSQGKTNAAPVNADAKETPPPAHNAAEPPSATPAPALLPSTAGNASVEGLVVDEASRLLAEIGVLARLETTGPDGKMSYQLSNGSSKTDADGRFRIEGLGAGTYGLFLLLPGSNVYLNDPSASIVLAEGESRNGLRLVYDPTRGVEVSGYVVDATGNPVQGAFVSARGTAALHDAVTDAKGHFSFTHFGPTVFNLAAAHPDLGSAMILQTDAKPEGFTITLSGFGSIEGRVIAEESGSPITDFELALYRRHWDADSSPAELDFTPQHSAEGKFRFDKLASEEDVTIAVRAEGKALSFVSEIEVVAGETTEVAVSVEKGRSFKGRVVSATGSPVAGAIIFEGKLPPMRLVESGKLSKYLSGGDGTFAVDAIAKTTTRLSAYDPATRASGSVDVAADVSPSTLLEIVLYKGAMIEGSVTLGDKPAERVYVDILYDSPEGTRITPVLTDTSGAFKLVDAPAGQGQLRAKVTSGPGMMHFRWRFTPITIAAGEQRRMDVHFPLGEASVEGRLLYNDVVPGNMGVEIDVVDNDGNRDSQSVPLGEDGTFRFDDAVPGTLEFRILHMTAPNSMGMWPIPGPHTLAPGATLQQDFNLTGSAEDPEEGFWDALVAAYPNEEFR